jgi:hypothetical protein
MRSLFLSLLSLLFVALAVQNLDKPGLLSFACFIMAIVFITFAAIVRNIQLHK